MAVCPNYLANQVFDQFHPVLTHTIKHSIFYQRLSVTQRPFGILLGLMPHKATAILPQTLLLLNHPSVDLAYPTRFSLHHCRNIN